MLEEFKKFVMRGNVVDLAVGVIIGAAFGGIVTSLVGRHFHADYRRRYRRPRLLELLHSAVEECDRDRRWRTRESRAPCWRGAISSRC